MLKHISLEGPLPLAWSEHACLPLTPSVTKHPKSNCPVLSLRSTHQTAVVTQALELKCHVADPIEGAQVP